MLLVPLADAVIVTVCPRPSSKITVPGSLIYKATCLFAMLGQRLGSHVGGGDCLSTRSDIMDSGVIKKLLEWNEQLSSIMQAFGIALPMPLSLCLVTSNSKVRQHDLVTSIVASVLHSQAHLKHMFMSSQKQRICRCMSDTQPEGWALKVLTSSSQLWLIGCMAAQLAKLRPASKANRGVR